VARPDCVAELYLRYQPPRPPSAEPYTVWREAKFYQALIIINRHSFIDSNGLIAWTINGKPGHGEDQDMWPVHRWSAFRRAARGGV
jgi:hypothetical protein